MIGTETAAMRDGRAPAGRPLTADLFKLAFRLHPGGVALVTAGVENARIALTVNSLASVSADPPILTFSVSVLSSSAPVLRAASSVVVHFLDSRGQDLADLGSAQGLDRFADDSRWSQLPTGEPVFTGARAWIRARVLHRIDAGGSTILVVEGTDTDIDADHLQQRVDVEGLVYWDRAYHRIRAVTHG